MNINAIIVLSLLGILALGALGVLWFVGWAMAESVLRKFFDEENSDGE